MAKYQKEFDNINKFGVSIKQLSDTLLLQDVSLDDVPDSDSDENYCDAV